MAEYIEREATLDALRKAHNPNTARMAISFAAVNSVPAADVQPVVRCRDCIQYVSDAGFCRMADLTMKEDDYCSRAVKRRQSRECLLRGF